MKAVNSKSQTTILMSHLRSACKSGHMRKAIDTAHEIARPIDSSLCSSSWTTDVELQDLIRVFFLPIRNSDNEKDIHRSGLWYAATSGHASFVEAILGLWILRLYYQEHEEDVSDGNKASSSSSPSSSDVRFENNHSRRTIRGWLEQYHDNDNVLLGSDTTLSFLISTSLTELDRCCHDASDTKVKQVLTKRLYTLRGLASNLKRSPWGWLFTNPLHAHERLSQRIIVSSGSRILCKKKVSTNARQAKSGYYANLIKPQLVMEDEKDDFELDNTYEELEQQHEKRPPSNAAEPMSTFGDDAMTEDEMNDLCLSLAIAASLLEDGLAVQEPTEHGNEKRTAAGSIASSSLLPNVLFSYKDALQANISAASSPTP